MEFIVTEIKQFGITARTPDDALTKRTEGQGQIVFTQRVVNRRGNRILEEWPIWAKALKQFATPEDKGIGDVVARMIGDENSATFKAWHLATFGRPCGCPERRELWNRQYPL